MELKKIKRGLGSVLVLVFLLSSCDQQRSVETYRLHYSDAIMGTRYTVKVPKLPDSLSNEKIIIQIKTLLEKLDGQMSTFKQDSELSQINKKQSTEWLAVSTSLYTVLKQAEIVAEFSKGAFDITVGPLVNLWGFGSKPMSFKVPKEELIKKQLAKTGYRHLLLDDSTQKIRKEFADLYLDLSAIAKGYAVDQVAALLESRGIADFMVEIGGELRLKGKNVSNKRWRIAVEKPAVERRTIQKVLPLTDIALATSGDYRNFFESDGVRFSHTIDPRSGKPITHKLASITILSDTTMKADALATALMVLGPDDGYLIAEQEEIAALFIIKTDDGFVEKASSEFIKRLR
jgi:thiamine biosynthesis lipoprotein